MKEKKQYVVPFEVISGLVIFGVVVCFLYPPFDKSYWSNAMNLILVAVACFVFGGLIGFVFGIPRYLQTNTQSEYLQYQANTNLEQISDWLSKILIGIGLTQLAAVPESIESVAENISNSLTGLSKSVTFCAAQIIFFTIAGFFFVYLWARLQLGRALTDADKGLNDPGKVKELLANIDQSNVDRGNDGLVETLEQQLQLISGDPKKRLEEWAKEYETIRKNFKPGNDRTKKMASLAAEIRSLSKKINPDAKEIFAKGGEGNRMVAISIVRSSLQPRHLPVVLDCISNSASAFEQYQALRAAEDMLPSLDATQKKDLRDAIEMAKDVKKLTEEDSDRFAIAERILVKAS